MDKKRKLQLALILAVVGLTIYNILPTLFFYAKPLKSPVSQERATEIANGLVTRVNHMEEEAIEWLDSYCQLTHVKPLYIEGKGQGMIALGFAKTEEAERLRATLPRAGLLIPNFSAQMTLGTQGENPKEVIVQRRLGVKLTPDLFEYVAKSSERYQELIKDRLAAVIQVINTPENLGSDILISYASDIGDIAKLYKYHPELAGRLATHKFRNINVEELREAFEKARDTLKQNKETNEKNELIFATAEAFLKQHPGLFVLKGASHPFFSDVSIQNDQIFLSLHRDVTKTTSERKTLVDQLLMDEAAKIARITHEKVVKVEGGYAIPLHQKTGVTGALVLNLDVIGSSMSKMALDAVKNQWKPEQSDLASLPIVTVAEYEKLSAQDKSLCLIITDRSVIARGIGQIAQDKVFERDFRDLHQMLSQHGFIGYPHQGDYVFEMGNFASALIHATREDFQVYGSGKVAWLEFSDVEQRIIAENKIDGQIHDELLKWHDEYRAATVSLNPAIRFDVPKPTRNVLWSNVQLTFKKMLRGDEKKVLRWGLDLSGGKSVQIELRDQNNQPVVEEADIKQGINELFDRVNKLGVSDVSIRQVGHHIALDFPGSQAMPASELIKASSMYFHVVNEKFSQSADRFLQEVWNEAVVTGQKTPEAVQAIAVRHLHGDAMSDAAKQLFENGLRLTAVDREIVSKVVMVKEGGGTHPLLIVFRDHALEGSSLENIRASYDPSKGNYLSFEVKKSAQADLYSWTSRYSKDNVGGGRGWRMAVLLNDYVISAPTLDSAIKDNASISGTFSQREVNQLASDLKAGSLTFTPHILCEKNISPELGKSDRIKGIGATMAALALVIGSMIAYYRFAGLVASVAVLFNLLILWATLQNLGATLSLAGIAGIILTVGMAVDANVLVFERMKEEFAISGRISSAIAAGYEKAFSAIVDSNLTTILAAIILLNFDAGPIKAFAICMIIGIGSSMFTALFMTRFYFNGWLKNPKHTKLSMSNWFSGSDFDFLKWARVAFASALLIIAAGMPFLYTQKSTIFGMDFTGGYALTLELKSDREDPAKDVSAALIKAGALARDFQVRQHDPKTHLQILFRTGGPFAGMPVHENGPKIAWVVDALKQDGILLASEKLESNWTAVSGQMSDSMRNNALLGLLLAVIGIFIYIAFRFEYKYAIAATLCLLHDVFVTVGMIGIFHACGVPVQIDLNTIAALMTIIGYSLNDTIIVFDRIREDVSVYRNRSMREVVNLALNTTLSRTSITSGTTLLVLLALLFLGGASIFSFSLVMVIGIIFGTLSSWFIACPLMLFFHGKEERTVYSK